VNAAADARGLWQVLLLELLEVAQWRQTQL
jgi:hypothetical protein